MIKAPIFFRELALACATLDFEFDLLEELEGTLPLAALSRLRSGHRVSGCEGILRLKNLTFGVRSNVYIFSFVKRIGLWARVSYYIDHNSMNPLLKL